MELALRLNDDGKHFYMDLFNNHDFTTVMWSVSTRGFLKLLRFQISPTRIVDKNILIGLESKAQFSDFSGLVSTVPHRTSQN